MKTLVTIFGGKHSVSDEDAVLLQHSLLGNGIAARSVTVKLDGSQVFVNTDAIAWIGDDDAPEVPKPLRAMSGLSLRTRSLARRGQPPHRRHWRALLDASNEFQATR